MTGNKETFLQAGMNSSIAKPIAMQTLQDELVCPYNAVKHFSKR